MTDAEKANHFKSLHIKGEPLVLYNIWDAGTARIVVDAGAKAIATGSWAVAEANGYQDGEKLPVEITLHNLKLIIEAVDLPVSIDLESGYGREPQQVADTVMRAIELGAVGFNLEDQIIGANTLFETGDQAARIAACRKALEEANIPAFINARTDVFMRAGSDAQIDLLLDEVLERARAYHQAGADGLFVPGLVDKVAIKTLCELSPLPVNIMMMPSNPTREDLAGLGVARISYGPGPYRAAMDLVAAEARAIYS
jgi:2-methylisocitrate lyase-like PEP mutase family enzyme